MQPPKLLIIDGLSIVRRVFEANPDTNIDSKVDGALKSAFGSFRRALRDHRPTHALVAFDAPGRTWRHELYSEYKATRTPMPPELRHALPAFMHRLRTELGLCVLSIPGVEAEDVMATAVTRWPEGQEVVALFTDKDLYVLLECGVSVYDHFQEEWRTAEWVTAKFGVGPELMPDYLALVGDSADDVPGVPQVGAKTAKHLLDTYGSLEGALRAAADSTDAKLVRLAKHADVARLSRKLVQLKYDVPLGITWRMTQVA